jgi:hypothetical protein
MALKFYTDKHIAKAVATQLRKNGMDVLRCEEIGLDEALDIEHLQRATNEDRIFITFDQDFPRIHNEWLKANKRHGGIMYCLAHVQGESGIGRIVDECTSYSALIVGGAGSYEEDIANHIFFVS